MIPSLKYYKLFNDVADLSFATFESACFDLRAYTNCEVKGFSESNKPKVFSPELGVLIMNPGDRALIPTGLILDIPEGHSVRLHIRSSVALKLGLSLANSEGVIDSDYVDPLFILVQNNSDTTVSIVHGERMAQAELVKKLYYELGETKERPSTKTDRSGGFGSTGNL